LQHENSRKPKVCSLILTAALDQLRVVASSASNDHGSRSRQHQQIGKCLLPVAANFFADDPAGTSSQRLEECWCGLLLTVALLAKQVCSPVGDRSVQPQLIQILVSEVHFLRYEFRKEITAAKMSWIY